MEASHVLPDVFDRGRSLVAELRCVGRLARATSIEDDDNCSSHLEIMECGDLAPLFTIASVGYKNEAVAPRALAPS